MPYRSTILADNRVYDNPLNPSKSPWDIVLLNTIADAVYFPDGKKLTQKFEDLSNAISMSSFGNVVKNYVDLPVAPIPPDDTEYLVLSDETHNGVSAVYKVVSGVWEFQLQFGFEGVNFASQLEVNAGVVPDKAIAPNTLAVKLADYVKKTVGVAANTDLNTVVDSGFYRLNTGHTNGPSFAVNYGQLIVSRGADTITQMVFSYQSPFQAAYRSGNPTNAGGTGSFGAWQEIATPSSAFISNKIPFEQTPAYGKSMRDIASYIESASGLTGIMKITLPVSWTSTMMWLKISGYNYAYGNAWELIVGGYNYANSSAWTNCSAVLTSSTGTLPFNQVRFGHDGSKCCILLGSTASTWQYPTVEVSEGKFSYSGVSSMTRSGWAISRITAETGITFTGGTFTMPNVAVPANVVTTDTIQTISSKKTFTAGIETSAIYRDTVIPFYTNATAAQKINTGGVLASDNYADASSVPANGIYAKGQIRTGIATGTAPLVIASTTVVGNLNADLLDGNHSTAFAAATHTHTDYVTLTTAQTISGAKTFSAAMAVNNTITSNNTIQGTRLISTIATGTAPLTVTSTTAVGNLNADMVDGLHANTTGVNNVANQLARTNGSGYLMCGYVNSSVGVETPAVGSVFVQNTAADGYLRKISLANFAAALSSSLCVVGTYTGNGAANRTISIGFTPRAVIIMDGWGATVLYPSTTVKEINGGLAVTGSGSGAHAITTNGFNVQYSSTVLSGVTYKYNTNEAKVYNYIAFA